MVQLCAMIKVKVESRTIPSGITSAHPRLRCRAGRNTTPAPVAVRIAGTGRFKGIGRCAGAARLPAPCKLPTPGVLQAPEEARTPSGVPSGVRGVGAVWAADVALSKAESAF